MPIPIPERQQQINSIKDYIKSKIPGAEGTYYADSFQAYADAHSSVPVSDCYIAWFLIEGHLTKSLALDLGSLVGGAGKAAGAIPKATSSLAPPNPLSGVAAVGDFFQRLTQPQTWTRVGEVILGGILVYAGVRALTHGSTTAGVGARKSATKPVRKVASGVAKVAVPEARLASRKVAKKTAPKTTARVAAHRAEVARYGARKPYAPPPPRPPRQPTVRVSHIYHHKGPAKP